MSNYEDNYEFDLNFDSSYLNNEPKNYDSSTEKKLYSNRRQDSSRLTSLLLGTVLALGVPVSAKAQSLIFPDFFDKHWPHAVTKPAVSLPLMIGLKEIGVPKTLSVVAGLGAPLVFSTIRTAIQYPDYWTSSTAWKDHFADTWAAATWSIPWQLKGNWNVAGLTLPKRWTSLALMTLIYTGLPPDFNGLNKWGQP